VEDAKFLTTVERKEQTIIKTHLIEVKEIPPVAGMHSMTRPITGISPFTVQLTPRTCKSGSFPIDRIDWDFGDGSPIKTISRFMNLSADEEVIYTDRFINDSLDVRNYDVIHTYKKTKKNYSIFYPSLTCYSANTNTFDSCSIPIGPISTQSLTPRTTLLKTRNTLRGNLYAMDIDGNLAFLSTNNTQEQTTSNINIPVNRIRDTYDTPEIPYYGNTGNDYVPQYEIGCDQIVPLFVFAKNSITTEDSTPLDPADNLKDFGEDILTEDNNIIIP
jgi:hypothetical protein